MGNNFYKYRIDRTLENLTLENKRLKNDIIQLNEEVATNQKILDFHFKLEKDFFSAGSLEDLIIKLNTCLLIRPDIDFVSLCLSKEYLESMLGTLGYEQLLPKVRVSTNIGYLSIIDESDVKKYIGRYDRTLFEKKTKGSIDIFFPDHGDEVKSQAIIPLVLRTHTIGSLNIGSTWSRHYYDMNMDRGLLDRLSAKLALAIDNILSHKKLALQKEILDRDIEGAAVLQKSLLPAFSFEIEALEVSTYFSPCYKLGGDFFDIIPISPDRVGIIVADVAGHGISAALIAAMLKFSLQMDNIENMSTNKIVSEINRKFCQILKPEDFITLSFVIIDMRYLSMNLVRAGHPYPIIFSSSLKDTVALNPSGPPVGLDADASYENMVVKLNSGDILFFYTDGLLEAIFDKNQAYDFDQLKLFLKQEVEKTYSNDKLLVKIKEVVKGKKLEDDVSLVIARIK